MPGICTVAIRGIVENPAVTEINIRSGPNTGYALLFKAPVGLAGLPVLEVRPDEQGQTPKDKPKIYQWFKLRFPNGQEGWGRDDLLDLEPGDWAAFGYGMVAVKTQAYALTRSTAPVSAASEAMAPAARAPEPVAPAAPTSAMPGASAVVIMRDGGRVRSGPGTNFAEITRLDFGKTVNVVDLKQEAGGPFRWAHVSAADVDGWMREDLLHFQGDDCARLGLKMDLYPAPMALPNYWWVRGFVGPQPQHPGWDLGANNGEPVLCGPNGATVLKVFIASKPTPDKPSVIHHGLKIGDPSIFSDPGWGYGYGHYVIVRYTNDQLPISTREYLKSKGLAGAAIFVMYAHLSAITVSAGQTLAGGAPIGACGTTGNSEAPHVHLEIRACANPNETEWSRMLNGLMDPGVLFMR